MMVGGFIFLKLSPLVEEMIQSDSYFSNGLKPPTRIIYDSVYVHDPLIA